MFGGMDDAGFAVEAIDGAAAGLDFARREAAARGLDRPLFLPRIGARR